MLSKTTGKLLMAQCHAFFEAILTVIFVGKTNVFCIHLLYAMVANSNLLRIRPASAGQISPKLGFCAF